MLVASVAVGVIAVGAVALAKGGDDRGEQQSPVAESVPPPAIATSTATTTAPTTTSSVFDRAGANAVASAALLQPGDTPAITGALEQRFSMELDVVADAPECADFHGVFHDPASETGYVDAWFTTPVAQSVLIYPTEDAAKRVIDAASSPAFADCLLVWQLRSSELFPNNPVTKYTLATGAAFDLGVAEQIARFWVNNAFEDQAGVFLRIGPGISVLNFGGTASGVTDEEVQAIITAAAGRLSTALGE